MNDDDLDRLLTVAGSEWRDGHEQIADVDVERLARRTAWTTTRWVPLVAAAAVLAVLAVVLVVRPTTHPAQGKPIAGPSTSPSQQSSARSATVPLEHAGTSVRYVGDDWIILSVQHYRAGARDAIEVRSVNRPSVVSLSVTTSWRKGGGIFCPVMAVGWLVYTDVQDEPSQYSPGPAQPWKLIAHSLSSGQERLLDSGMTDMESGYACAVRDGARLAWTSGQSTRTTIYDLASTSRTSVAVAGDPIALSGSDLLLARGTRGRGTTVIRVNTVNGASHNLASVDGSYVESSAHYIVWSEPVAPSDWTSSSLHLCRLPSCTDAGKSKSVIDAVVDGLAQTAIGEDYVAWSTGDNTVRVRPVGGRTTTLSVDGVVDSLAADGSLLVFVEQTDASTAQEKDVLHLVRVTR